MQICSRERKDTQGVILCLSMRIFRSLANKCQGKRLENIQTNNEEEKVTEKSGKDLLCQGEGHDDQTQAEKKTIAWRCLIVIINRKDSDIVQTIIDSSERIIA